MRGNKRSTAGVLILLALCLHAAGQKASLILHNANVYTMDPARPTAKAVAIGGDRILHVGTDEEVRALAGPATERIDCGGRFLMPGLIEGHGHIHNLGTSLVDLNLMRAGDWDEVLSMVAEAVGKSKPGDWIVGRGWHQEKWSRTPERSHLGYPYHESLDRISPDNPVMLTHASGHSVYVNALALQRSGITEHTPSPEGGDIVRDASGRIVGVLEETAQALAQSAFRKWYLQRPLSERKSAWRHSIGLAEAECLRHGITTFVDAGSSFEQVDWMKELAASGALSVRHWLMVRSGMEEIDRHASELPYRSGPSGHLTVSAIKVSLDGALGSYGAWLLEPYADRAGFIGQNTFSIPELKRIADFAWRKGLQLCVHAIGDRANRETIDIFAGQIARDAARDHRWRIEHAQHVNPSDIPRFRKWNIIASMQGIHCTSDAPFVAKRLGEARAANGAYMWRAFLDAGVLVNNGTDVPVEDIDPFANLHASVTRMRADGAAFHPEQRMTRHEALYSYTLANAKAVFEEDIKGSLTKGKLADIVLLSNDLVHCTDEQIRQTRVLLTIVGGKVGYRKP